MVHLAERIRENSQLRKSYDRKQNTARLVQAVVTGLRVSSLNGDQLCALAKLTWITKSKGQPSPGAWKTTKVPALETLFSVAPSKSEGRSLPEVLAKLGLPEDVEGPAREETGFVNFYNAYRNQVGPWCAEWAAELREIILGAARLGEGDQARIELGQRVGKLPGVVLPGGKGQQAASSLITPLIACLDRHSRFPVITGGGVQDLLREIGLKSSPLEDQVRGLIGLIGRCGVADAFMIDTAPEKLAECLQGSREGTGNPTRKDASGQANGAESKPLQRYDESERYATIDSGTIKYENLHNKMTNSLRGIFRRFHPKEGNPQDNKFDLLLHRYHGERDLLIEVKPHPDAGSLRIAIGQLYDYRLGLANGARTDLAVLTIGAPEDWYRRLLWSDRRISMLWFTDESCKSLGGEGIAWRRLKGSLRREKETSD
jgi:hypothetical protein